MSLNFGPLKSSCETKYVIDVSGRKPSCLPSDIDMSDLIEITGLTDTWRRYVSKSRPGVVYDGVVYAKLAQEQSGE